MEAEMDTITIHRVVNGWMLRPANFRLMRDGYDTDRTYIAETPDALCELVEEWARKQSTPKT